MIFVFAISSHNPAMLHGADKPCSLCPLLNKGAASRSRQTVSQHTGTSRVPDADLHSASRSLVRCQHEPPKKPSSPRYREDLIENGGRALTVGSLYGELISWRDLCALFKVCRVSEGATHHSAQPDSGTSGLAASG